MSDRPRVWTRAMTEVHGDEWPVMLGIESVPVRVWRSNDYLAVLYQQRADGHRRLTVNRTRKGADGKWRDGITWDELQRVKDECLGPETWCVEVYPARSALVNENNQRHLWVLDGPPETRFPERATVTDGEITAAMAAVRRMIEEGMLDVNGGIVGGPDLAQRRGRGAV